MIHLSKFSDSPLVDPLFDLERRSDVGGTASGWRDKRTGLSFEIERDRDASPLWGAATFWIWDNERLPRAFIAHATLKLVSEERRPICRREFRISRSNLFADVRQSSDVDRSNIRRAIIRELGGEDAFFEFCLKAIRACHLQYFGSSNELGYSVRNIADQVEFEIAS